MRGIHHLPTTGMSCDGCEIILSNVHWQMRAWFRDKKRTYNDLHISWGWRGKDDQNAFLAQGSSDLKWPKSRHNRMVPIDVNLPFDPADESCPNARKESLALDLFQITAQYPKGKWDVKFMIALDAENKKNGEPILNGGTWPGIGDYNHFEYAGPL